jgi:hypothetical protein
MREPFSAGGDSGSACNWYEFTLEKQFEIAAISRNHLGFSASIECPARNNPPHPNSALAIMIAQVAMARHAVDHAHRHAFGLFARRI